MEEKIAIIRPVLGTGTQQLLETTPTRQYVLASESVSDHTDSLMLYVAYLRLKNRGQDLGYTIRH